MSFFKCPICHIFLGDLRYLASEMFYNIPYRPYKFYIQLSEMFVSPSFFIIPDQGDQGDKARSWGQEQPEPMPGIGTWLVRA